MGWYSSQTTIGRDAGIKMRVLIAVPRQEMRAALGLLLSQEPDTRVVGESGNSQELLASLEAVCPDVVLLDWELPGLPTADLLAQLYAHNPAPRVLILCSKTESEQAALAAGAHTFVDKTAHPKHLLTALRVLQLESEYE
jgi:DNA-binding NarL/FixJ family response regulator